ncbi:MAG: histidinol dehydrogenase [Bacteroidota bacterium]
MTIYQYPDPPTLTRLLQRPMQDATNLEAAVQEIANAVKRDGDKALKSLTTRFDGVQLDELGVSEEALAAAQTALDPTLKAALHTAQNNIRQFHESQKIEYTPIETMPGVFCWQKSVGIEKVGLYIPGGTAPLISTVLMLGIPAQIAGCQSIVLCTPPQKDGTIHPAILYAAQLCGIRQIFKVGGAQAIAAMAYGTESIPAVYKIYGPGNQYVTAAKQLVSRAGIAIDMPAGPSEVLVLADESAQAAFVAADLLSQAEHGPDSQVVLLTYTEETARQILVEIDRQLDQLPRANIARQALENSPAIIARDAQQALAIINQYAPEHLILAIDRAQDFAQGIQNAGSVFMGHYTPESVGDYASGTNHTLPTNGFARAYSGLNLDAFVKKITFQQLSAEGLQNIGATVEQLAAAEQLEAHKNAVSIRLKAISTTK